MSWRVKVELDFPMDGIGIHMGQRMTDGRLAIVQPVDMISMTGQEAIAHSPALRMDDELGRALLDALALHYGGAVDARTSREDMLTERKRTDKLLDTLIVIAQRPLARPEWA